MRRGGYRVTTKTTTTTNLIMVADITKIIIIEADTKNPITITKITTEMMVITIINPMNTMKII